MPDRPKLVTPVAPPASFDALVSPTDRILVRAGRPVRVRHDGEWSELADAPQDPAAWRTMLAATPDATVDWLGLPDGRTIECSVLNADGGPALWMRAVDLPAPDPDLLSGPIDKLEEVLGLQTGLVLAAGPDTDVTRTLLHMLAAMRIATCDESMLIASDDRTYRHAEGSGALLRTPIRGLGATIEAMRPDSLVLDGTGADAPGTLGCLGIVPFVLAGLLAPEPAAMMPRWLARGGDATRAAAQLAGTPVGLVMVQGNGPDGRIRFNAWVLSESEQAMAMRGAVGDLALSLEKQGAYQRRLRLHRA